MKIRQSHQKDYLGHPRFIKILNLLKYFRDIKPKTYAIKYLNSNIAITGYKRNNKILVIIFFKSFNSWAIQTDIYQNNSNNIFVKSFYTISISDKDYEMLKVRYATNDDHMENTTTF